MTNQILLSLGFAGILSALTIGAAEQRSFEMRVYYAPEGKLEDLKARFQNHTLKLFEKHGISNIGYWEPVENPDRKLVYILAFPSREAARKSWEAFFADSEWKAVVKKTEANGRLVTKVESTFLVPTDFSPAVQPTVASPPRVYELRTYKAAPERLGALLARFRDHTLALFEKHGIKNFGYWTPADAAQGSGDTLIYLLAHADRSQADASWKAFRQDPTWLAARKASEEKAGGSLTVKVESVYLCPTSFSPAR